MSKENKSSEVSENYFTGDNMECCSNSSNELQICDDNAPLMPIKKPRRARKR